MGENKVIAVLSSHTPSLFWFRIEMMQSFIGNGYEVYALGNEEESKWKTQFIEKKIIYRQIKVQRNGINPLNDLKALDSIKKVLKEIKPDKIFTFQAKTVIYGGIAANQLGITEVYPLIAGVGSMFLKNDFRTNIIRKILITEYRIAMRKSPVVFFQNHEDEIVFRSNHIINKQKVVILHGSGVNTEYFNVQPLPKQMGFLCISRLIRDKGIYEYLEACKMIKKKYPDIRCMLVGPFDSNPSAIQSNDLQPFIEAGIEYFGEQVDVRPYLAQCSVYVLPSYREGTPKTVLEAMSSGRAIITTDTPGCRETVMSGKNGILVPVKDTDSLYNAMEQFINNLDIISSMAKCGRIMAETIFDVRLVNKCICEAMGLI